jgi:acyl-CoA reductase-like NAD-dependent aldehyde dehydrogenase
MKALTPEEVEALCRQMPAPDPQRAREVIPEVARRWLDPGDPFRQGAIERIVGNTGYARSFVTEALTHMMKEIADHLVPMVKMDLPEGWIQRPNLRSRWVAPRLTFCLFAGNVPGVPAPDIAGALAIGSAVLCKVARDEPHFGPIFIESIAAIDPVLAKSAAAVYWPGASHAQLDVVMRFAEAVVAYGSDESLLAVQQRVKPGMPFLAYGHRVSFAVVGEEGHEAVSRAAYDVANFDQQGCVSPHVIYVRGDARAFAVALARRLEMLEAKHPRAPATMGEAAAIRRARDEAEFKEGAELFASPDTAWSVIYDAKDRTFRPSCLGRTVRVHPITSFDELPRLVHAFRRYLQTCAFAGRTEDAERLAVTLGITRVCALGRAMQTRITWNHDGQPKLSRLVRWVDIDDDLESGTKAFRVA